MSQQQDNEYQIETRRRSRSRTPLVDALSQQADAIKKKKKAANVPTIIEEKEPVSVTQNNGTAEPYNAKNKTSDYSSENSTPESKKRTRATTDAQVTTQQQQTQKREEQQVHVVLATSTPIMQTAVTTTSSSSTRVLRNVKKFIAGDFSSSTPLQNKNATSSSEVHQNTLNTTKEESRVSASSFNRSPVLQISGDLSDHIAYKEYKEAGEYWNVTPKTDYTYSKLSSYRRILAPGVVAMPNMSRQSLDKHDERVQAMIRRNPEKATYIRRRYTYADDLAYDSMDESDFTSYGVVEHRPSLLKRWTTGLFTFNKRTTKSNMHYKQATEKSGFIARQLTHVSNAFIKIFRFIYLFISTVMCVDTWLLKSTRPSSGAKKFFLILLLLLLPFLLLCGLFYYRHPDADFPPKDISNYSFNVVNDLTKVANYFSEENFNQLLNIVNDQTKIIGDYYAYLSEKYMPQFEWSYESIFGKSEPEPALITPSSI